MRPLAGIVREIAEAMRDENFRAVTAQRREATFAEMALAVSRLPSFSKGVSA